MIRGTILLAQWARCGVGASLGNHAGKLEQGVCVSPSDTGARQYPQQEGKLIASSNFTLFEIESNTRPAPRPLLLLSKPLVELESIGFIKPLPKEERFIKVTKGQWKVVFDRGASEARALMSPEQVDALEQLKGRGVTATKASKLVRSYSPERIAEKIAIHDWLLARADKRCSADPPGFLVAAIQDDFPAPTGFLKTREQAKSELRVITTPTDRSAPSRTPENQDQGARVSRG